jgi:phosphoserine phosphatase
MNVPSSRDPIENSVRIVAFDVDGTLVEHDEGLVIWQVLNRLFSGSAELNAKRFQAFRSGEITYAEWVRLDIEGWKQGGATRDRIVKAIRDDLRLVPGAREVTVELARRGYFVAVVSGTLDIVLDTLFPEHPFHQVFANRIRFDDAGRIDGWTATPFDMSGKAEALRLLADQTATPASEIAFVGDHLNDLDALRFAGCPIAYDPKDDAVRSAAKHVVARGHLRQLLSLLPGPPQARVESEAPAQS